MPAAGSAIQYKTLNQLVQIQLDYIAANAPTTLAKPLGPFVTAVCYATALMALVLQRLVQLALQAARLSTAIGADADSFVNDFGLSRLTATFATGLVSFGRLTPAPSLIQVPVGAIVQTSGPQPIQFSVVPPVQVITATLTGCTTTVLKVASTYGFNSGDTVTVDGFAFTGASTATVTDSQTLTLASALTVAPGVGVKVTDATQNPSYDATAAVYNMALGQSSVLATVQALEAGSDSNVAAGAINKIGSALAGVDTVSNSLPFTNGVDVESDAELRTRFALYILGLSKATKTAIASAISNVQQGLVYNFVEPSQQISTVTIGGSTTTTLKVVSTAGMTAGDHILVDNIPFVAGPGTILTVTDSVTLALNGTLASAPGSGIGVTDTDGNGTPDGTFSVSIDDGSGVLPASVLAQVQAAIEQVRPIGIRAIATAASIIASGAGAGVAIAARVTYPLTAVPDVLALQVTIRSAISTFVNSLKPGDKFNVANIYKTIFNATSPGDLVVTVIALAPVSTTLVLQLGTTVGMQPGQLVKVGTQLTALGALPLIATVDSDTQITLATPLANVPPPTTVVTTFSISPDQTKDVHSLQVSLMSGSLTTVSPSTSTVLQTSTVPASVTVNDYVIVTDESTTPFTYYQANPVNGILAQVQAKTSSTVTVTQKLGTIDATGAWTEKTTPPTGLRVVTFLGGQVDVAPSPLILVRNKTSGPNQLLIQMEAES